MRYLIFCVDLKRFRALFSSRTKCLLIYFFVSISIKSTILYAYVK